MLENNPTVEHLLRTMTRHLVEVLQAQGGICYYESAPDIFTVAAALGRGFTPAQKSRSIPRRKLTAELAGNTYPESDSVPPLHPVLHRGKPPLCFRAGAVPGAQARGVELLLYFPAAARGHITAVFEIVDPDRQGIFASRRQLKSLAHLVQNIVDFRLQLEGLEEVSAAPGTGDDGEPAIIGSSVQVQNLKDVIARIAPTDSTVLLKGETGTGKNVVARALHRQSSRSDMPFVKVSCAAIPDDLLESELFGHERGAFTGALHRRIGRFERAHLGTIFLDEIGEVSKNLQVKLLNVLQDREIERLGGTETISLNIRIIAATNKDLEKAIEAGEFREDLYYRLNVVPILIPPLRERIDDLEPLVDYFIHTINLRLNLRFEKISSEALFLLKKYHWPGNVRELENIIERALVIGTGPVIMPSDLPREIFGIIDSVRKPQGEFIMREGRKSLWEIEKGIIERALMELNWNQSKTARELGIERNRLRYRIKKYKIKTPGR